MKKLYTFNELKRAYIDGGRNDSRSGLRLGFTNKLFVISFDEWFNKKYKLNKKGNLK